MLHDSKKQKDVNLDKAFLGQNQTIFTKFLIKSWIETFINQNQTTYSVYIDYSFHLYHKFRNVA